MNQYGLDNIRNLCLLSHSGAGKTSLSEAILFITKTISRLGRTEDGSTTSDYDPEEIKRRMSLNLALLPFQWQNTKINLIDTPGYPDFVGEVKAAIRVSESAIIVVCASSGVEVGTEQTWRYCEEAGIPRFIFINKMDRENANFNQTLAAIQNKFGQKCVPVQIPIGSQKKFKGIVDLLTMKGYTGSQMQEGEIPPSLMSEVDAYREKIVEAVAENDDTLLEKYLGGEQLAPEEIERGLKQGILSGKIVPVLVGSALQSIGVTTLFDKVVSYLPSPGMRDVILLNESCKEEGVKPGEDVPLAALVFKTSADPYVGKLTYLRIYNGVMDSNSQSWNANRNEAERIGQLYIQRGKSQEAVPQLRAGDIGVVAKLGVTNTGDTLCAKDKPVKIAPPVFPVPVFRKAVHPKTKLDLDKLGSSLSRMAEEDPAIHIHRDFDTGETILSGMGDVHIEVTAEKMQRKFGVSVVLEIPKVPYKETITVPTKAEYKHKKQTGGHGQYGHVMLELQPLPKGSGHQFEDQIVGGSIPRNYVPAVEKGVNEGFQEGVLAGYPVTDLKVIVYDGSFHPVDSSDICFKIAGAGALKKGLSQGHPVLLEPIMNLKVTVPEEYTGDILSDLNTKRGRVQGMNPQDRMNIIEAQVPLAELLKYSIDLKSITQGRGTFTTEFSHYEEAPSNITQKVIAEKQTEKAKE